MSKYISEEEGVGEVSDPDDKISLPNLQSKEQKLSYIFIVIMNLCRRQTTL